MSAAPGGATAASARAAAPDLARGLMLALIALANVHLFLVTGPGGFRGYPPETPATATVDRVVTLAQMVLVDGRAYPLFAALVGYGLVRLAARHPPAVVRRRAVVLVAVGAVHGILLFPGDIIGAYGLVALVLAGALASARPRTLLVVASLLALVAALLGAATGLPLPGPVLRSLSDPSALGALAARPGEWLNTSLGSALLTAPAVLVGAWAARVGVLDDPARHRALLARWAGLGLPAGVVLGLPLALAAAGSWTPPIVLALAAGAAHAVGGYAAALGYLGLLGLASTRRLPGAGLLAGAGTWSMTCYVTQSVVFCALFAAWAGDLGRELTVATASLCGLVVWGATVTVAGGLARRGHRGPLETVVRRATYGRP